MADPTPVPSAGGAKKNIKAPRRRRGLGGLFNLLLLVGIIVTIGLFVWAEQQRREAQEQLRRTATELEDLRNRAETSGQEVADEVLGKLRNHMDVPTDPQPTVATIVDAQALKEANEFYEPAENGDHLIITATRAILYDPERDIILDVVPVTIDPNQPPTEEGQTEGEPLGSPDPDASPSPEATGSPAPSPLSPSPSPSPIQ